MKKSRSVINLMQPTNPYGSLGYWVDVRNLDNNDIMRCELVEIKPGEIASRKKKFMNYAKRLNKHTRHYKPEFCILKFNNKTYFTGWAFGAKNYTNSKGEK